MSLCVGGGSREAIRLCAAVKVSLPAQRLAQLIRQVVGIHDDHSGVHSFIVPALVRVSGVSGTDVTWCPFVRLLFAGGEGESLVLRRERTLAAGQIHLGWGGPKSRPTPTSRVPLASEHYVISRLWGQKPSRVSF